MPLPKAVKNPLRLVRRIAFWTTTVIIGCLLIAFIILQIPAVQQFIRTSAVHYLEEKLQTKVELEDIDINLYRHIVLKRLYVEDREGETLLYAGHAAIRIRSIDPLHKTIRLRSIELGDARANIYRHPNDSNFNYTFISDAFASNNEKDTTQQQSDIELVLKKIHLERTAFNYADSLLLQGYQGALNELVITFNKFSIRDQILSINTLTGDACQFSLNRLPGRIATTETEPPRKELVHIAPGDWIIEANQVQLKNSFFGYENQQYIRKSNIIDFNHLALSDLNIDLEEITFIGDTVQGFINEINTREQSGFELTQLKTGFFFSATQLDLNGLQITTPSSFIGNNISLRYATLNDFNRLFTDIFWKARLNGTVVATGDLAYFSSALAAYQSAINLTGLITGPLSDLNLQGCKISLDDAAFLTTDGQLTGLPSIDEFNMQLDIHPLVADMPGLDDLLGKNALPKELLELGSVNFKGNLNGSINNIQINGTTYSTIGDVIADIRIKNDAVDGLQYSGTFATNAFSVGKLAGMENVLGDVSMLATLQGKSNNGKNVVLFSSQISSIEYNGYSFQQINASGELTNEGFNGRLNMNDPNGSIAFDGSIAHLDSIPVMNFAATLKDANLYAMKLYNTPLKVSATTSIDIIGKDINSFLGDALITNATIQSNDKLLEMDRIEVHSSQDKGIRTTNFLSDYLNIDIEGNYSVDQLPLQVETMVKYYLKGIEPINDSLPDQDFTFTISGTNLENITSIFYPDIRKATALKMQGNFNSGGKTIQARAIVTELDYLGYQSAFIAAEIANEENKQLSYFVRSSPIYINDQIELPITSLEGYLLTDSIFLNLKMGRDTDPERLNLHTGIHLEDSLLRLRVLPSEIFVNDSKWEIQPNNSLSYDFKSFIAEDFTLTNGERILSVSSTNKPGSGPVLRVFIDNILLNDITTIAQYDDYKIDGDIDANITISDPFDSISILGFVNINELAIDEQTIGNINLTATKLFDNPRFNFNMLLKGNNSMRAYGYYYSGDVDSINFKAEISKIPFLVVEPFTTGLISDVSGDAYGEVRVQGALDDLSTTGYLEMRKGGFTFDYLGTAMTFDFQKVELFPDRIYLTPNKIFDPDMNEGWIQGNILHQSYNQFYFDSLQFNADNFILMNATQNENPDFFGFVAGQVNALITGPLEDLNITVSASPNKNPGRENIVYIPAYGSGNVNRHNFIQFVDRSQTDSLVTPKEEKNVSVVTVNTFVSVTPDVEVRIPLSSDGSDDLKGSGFGDLFINVNTLGKVEISGILKISSGSYDFSFEGLSTKRFAVKEGGTIIFNQDPYQAKLNLTAVYQADKVQKLGLISDLALSDQEIQEARKTTPVDVYINIGGTLEAPDISFDIVLPQERGGGLSEFEQRLNEIKADQNELNKQVFGLLMLNQFLPKDLNAGAALGSGVNSSISDFITNQLSGYFSDWIAEIIPNAEIDIGYQKIGSGDIDLSESDQTQFDLALKQKLFDDVLTIKVGGTYSYETTGNNPNNNLAGDFEVEYKITPDGRVRVKAFRRSDFDAVASKNDTRTGLGLFYTKDFDSFSELFGNRKERENTP